jgi:beta-glucanase (GH16 family)
MTKIFIPVIVKPSLDNSIWSDEFNGDKLDLSKWDVAEGLYDPDYHDPNNVKVDNGNLVITGKREEHPPLHYSTGWITSRQSWKYGRFEARIKLPVGRGIWPAFWMLPLENKYGKGVASGELDIMELWGHLPSQVKGTIHYGWPWKFISTPYDLKLGDYSQDYHVFAIEWRERAIRWYVDDTLYKTENAWYSSGGMYPAPFDQLFYLVLNVGIWREVPPDKSTVFPTHMLVDYVKVYA